MEEQRTDSLQIELLGSFRATYGGRLIPDLDAPRLQALLACLLLHPGTPKSRQHIAFTFWPDSSEKQALTNLRQLLHHLRHALPDSDRFIEADAKTIMWKSDAPARLDVAMLKQALARADSLARQGIHDAVGQALEEAVEHYTGDLLPSCYDEWIVPEREQLREHYVAALDRLVSWMEERRMYPEAIRYARLLLQNDPLRETTYRSLMRLHAVRRDRASALRVYHECVTVLERELGVKPAPTTRELYERLLNAQVPAAASGAAPHAFTREVPLVGRQNEWRRLQSAWRTARSGRAHFVYIAGEAGIGKTRLAEELLTWTGRQGTTTARARCYAAEGRLALSPVSDWLRSEPIRKSLRDVDAVWRSEIARILPELRSEDPQLLRPEPLSESWQRQRLFEGLARGLLAAPQPIVLLVDDLQWSDRDTLEWLHYLFRVAPGSQLLVMGTARVEELGPDHPLHVLLLELRGTGQLTEVMLEPLSASETAALAEHVASRALEDGQAAHLYRETEGNPLFVVEGVRAELFQSDGSPARRATGAPDRITRAGGLPPRVQAILTARMTQLSTAARELAQLAATIGRAFTVELLAEAGRCDEDTLVRSLDELWQRRIVREYGAGTYDFSHDKLREVAYAEVPPARRRLLHRRVAEAIERLYGEELDAYSGQLAAHYERAELPERALPYYQRAGEVAQRVHANEEAIESFRRALSLLDVMPEGPQRAECEVRLRILLGTSLMTSRGWADPDVSGVYERARSLCRPEDDPAPLLHILWGLRTHHVVRAELEAGRDLGMEFLQLARRQDDPILVAAAHLAMAYSLFHLGELNVAREHLEHLVALPASEQYSSHRFPLGPDLGVFGRSYASHVLWHLGYPEKALTLSREALARADALEHPFSRAIALAYAAMLHQFRREPDQAHEHAAATIALCDQYGFAYYLAWGRIIRGWAWSRQGKPEEGRAAMQKGLDDLRATGARLRLPYYLTLLAEAAGTDGDVAEGLAYVDEAFMVVHASKERWQEAELHRLKGMLLLEQDATEAASCFRTALELARRRNARSLALRAAVSLHRLRRHDDDGRDSRALLKHIYDSFTEGLDTPDLKEARELLEEDL